MKNLNLQTPGEEMNFDGKAVIVTGAGKGLGYAYAHYFARHGASVIVNNRVHEGESESSADRVVAEIIAAGGTATAEYSSVEDVESGERLMQTALSSYGRLDCLVANAGVTESATFHKQSLDDFMRNFNINLVGTINVVHPVFKHFYEQGRGNIVINTSSAGLFGQLGLPAYSTSKAGLIGLMRSLSQEGAAKNVIVNAISPYASTQMVVGHISDEANRVLTCESVAEIVGWLAAGTVSGEVLIAGGDHVARADVRTSASISVNPWDESTWDQISTAPLHREFNSGRENYEGFVDFLSSS